MPDKPDFVIPGAMKSGTSSLEHILSSSEEVFMTQGELNLLSWNDYMVKKFSDVDYSKGDNERLEIYDREFSGADTGQVLGERSNSYLPSVEAPERLRNHLKDDVKLIFMLRDPVSRTYSHYKHYVRGGYTSRRFSRALDTRREIIERSIYKEQIERYKDKFPEAQMKFVVFEEFVENQQEVIDEVCEFLEIGRIDLEGIDTHRNRSPGFRSFKAQLFFNSLSDFIGHDLDFLTRTNRSCKISFPDMDEELRDKLEEFFHRENRGISNLIGKDVSKHWSGF
jgi:hypothetical protein